MFSRATTPVHIIGVIALMLSICGVVPAVAAITLTWQPSMYATGYQVYYGGASRQYDVVLDTGLSTSAVMDGLTPGEEYFFAVTAYNPYGESDYSNEVHAIIPLADTIAPIVLVTNPVNGDTVARRGLVNIQVQATDAMGVTRVEMFVDGTLLCAEASAPYSCAWNVPSPPRRTYQLQSTAFDAAGNRGLSAIVTVTAR